MRYLLMLSLMLFSLPALTDERFVGIWMWSGNQCRDQNLSQASGRNVFEDPSGFSLDSAFIMISEEGSGTLQVTLKGRGHKESQSGVYTVSDRRIDINDHGDTVALELIDSQLVNKSDKNTPCREGESFVRVFNKVKVSDGS